MQLVYLDHNCQKQTVVLESSVPALRQFLRYRFEPFVEDAEDFETRHIQYHPLGNNDAGLRWSIELSGFGMVGVVDYLPKEIPTHDRYEFEKIFGEFFAPLMEGMSPEQAKYEMMEFYDLFFSQIYGPSFVASALGEVKANTFSNTTSHQRLPDGSVLISPHDGWEVNFDKSERKLVLTKCKPLRDGGMSLVNCKVPRENGIPRRRAKGRSQSHG